MVHYLVDVDNWKRNLRWRDTGEQKHSKEEGVSENVDANLVPGGVQRRIKLFRNPAQYSPAFGDNREL
jgi:hypothetical protein